VNAEIQRADPKERRKFAYILAVAAIAGVLVIVIYRHLLSWAVEDPQVAIERLSIVIATFYILTVPIVLVSRSMWAMGRAVITANRFPAPGMKVIRDAVVITGVKAVVRGRLLQGFAFGFSVIFLALPIVLWLIMWKMLNAF